MELVKTEEQLAVQNCSSNSEDDSFGQDNQSLSSNSRRQRVTFDSDMKSMLMEFFIKCQYPDYTQRVELAEKAGVTESRIQVWFQNRRTRLRRKNHVIAKPRNLPGPMVGNSLKGVGQSPDFESSGRPQPLACIVQPQPRADDEVSKNYAMKRLNFKSPDDIRSANESNKAFPLKHSIDRMLKPMSARNEVNLEGFIRHKRSSEAQFSQPNVVEIAPLDSSEDSSEDSHHQEEPLDLSLKKHHNSNGSVQMIASLPFPWFSVFPPGFCVNPLASSPAAAAALWMKHNSP